MQVLDNVLTNKKGGGVWNCDSKATESHRRELQCRSRSNSFLVLFAFHHLSSLLPLVLWMDTAYSHPRSS